MGFFSMPDDRIKARLNLNAVLQNMEELLACDRTAAEAARRWNLVIQFSIRGGLAAFLRFRDGACRFGRGRHAKPDVHLFFKSPVHFNRMMDGKANPIPLKGFTRLGFLRRQLPIATQRLEYFLKPTPERLAEEDYLAVNTLMMLNTAVFAAVEIARHDPIGRQNAAHLSDGRLLLKILPEGPAAHLIFDAGGIAAGKGPIERPSASLFWEDGRVANAFLNGRMDAFAAIAAGQVQIRGQIPLLDALSNILDRVPLYLQ
jgi:hypothetical protein